MVLMSIRILAMRFLRQSTRSLASAFLRAAACFFASFSFFARIALAFASAIRAASSAVRFVGMIIYQITIESRTVKSKSTPRWNGKPGTLAGPFLHIGLEIGFSHTHPRTANVGIRPTQMLVDPAEIQIL